MFVLIMARDGCWVTAHAAQWGYSVKRSYQLNEVIILRHTTVRIIKKEIA